MSSNYTVIQLAELLGVPRTTVNDWLSRYSQYVETVTVGKRRVYPEKALEVLKGISELRNRGLSSFEIEAELAKTHPVQPEIAGKENEKNSSGKTEEKTPSSVPARPVTAEEYELIARKSSEELASLIAGSFSGMAGRMEELEKESARSRKRLAAGYWVMLVMLILLGGASALIGVLLFQHGGTLKKSSETAEQGLRLSSELREKSVVLAGSQAEMQQGILKLRQDLAVQQKEFEASLRFMKDEQALLRNDFAARQKAYLEDLERMASLNREAEKRLDEAAKRVRELSEAVEVLRDSEKKAREREKQLLLNAAMEKELRKQVEKKAAGASGK